ncbi:MAG: thiamine pyrophosphate-dependent dehydrogenase E1 component subunit alpha [Pseudomonadota bacterium]
MELDKTTLLECYRRMLLVRAMEEKHDQLLKEGRIQLMSHFGTGQEAVSIGVTAPLRREDILFGTHRGVGEYIGKGMTARDIWAEYLGKRTGLCKGKGTLHLCDKKNNIPGLVSSLGSDFSYSVGAALAAKMQNTGQITLYFVGEGTCNQADFHPSLCMAALWKLPLIFAVCTNQFCELSYMCEHYPTEDVAPRAAGYGMPYAIVDGQDIETTYEATQKAVEHARSGQGPFLVEYKTFRMALHFSGDPGGYVKPEDVEKWGKRDPIDICRAKILARGWLGEDDDKNFRAKVVEENEQALAEGFAAPDPTIDDLFEDVYAERGVL